MIATLAAADPAREVLIASMDQDYHLLLRDPSPRCGGVRVFNTAMRPGNRFIGTAQMTARYNVTSQQCPDLKAPPLDEKDASDQSDILGWVASGAPLFRVERPATPPKDLAVYFALLDDASHSIMLVDHVKARTWLLPGGHVDDGEDPAGQLSGKLRGTGDHSEVP